MSVITGEQIMLVGSDDGDDGRPNMELPMSLDDKQNLTNKKKRKVVVWMLSRMMCSPSFQPTVLSSPSWKYRI